MTEQEFSPQESLSLINDMIRQVKYRYSENGFLYLLWGWLVFGCSLAQFALLYFLQDARHYQVWLLTWLAFIFQIFYTRRRKRKARFTTYTQTIVSYVWITFVVLLLLLGYLLVRTANPVLYYQVMNPLLLALYGMPTFLTGIVIRFKPLRVGGICCWVLALVACAIPYHFQLLLIAAAMGIAWIVPGYILRNQYQQNSPHP